MPCYQFTSFGDGHPCNLESLPLSGKFEIAVGSGLVVEIRRGLVIPVLVLELHRIFVAIRMLDAVGTYLAVRFFLKLLDGTWKSTMGPSI